jgi:hypothetical protein
MQHPYHSWGPFSIQKYRPSAGHSSGHSVCAAWRSPLHAPDTRLRCPQLHLQSRALQPHPGDNFLLPAGAAGRFSCGWWESPPPTHCFRGHSRPRHPALARLALLDSVTAAGTSPDPAASLAGCAPACAWSSAWGNRWSGTAGNAGGLPRPRPEGYQWILASWLKTLASVVGCRDCHVRSISNTN